MKIFHLSDLHIGLKLMNRDLGEDQRYIFRQVSEYAKEERPDAIVIAGDIYDKSVPSAEAVELFDSFVCMLTEAVPEAQIMMITGNHDSASRVDVYRNILARQKLHMIGQPPRTGEEWIEKVTLEDAHGPVHFYLLPFVKPSMVKLVVGTDENGNNLSYDATLHKLIGRENVNQSERNVLVSHQFYLPVGADAEAVERMDSEIRTVGNIDEVKADVLSAFDYCALGHIHKPMKVGNEYIRYCGTPLACSVSEAGQTKGILCVSMEEKGNRKIEVLPLKPMRQVRVLRDTFKNVLKMGCDDYVTVILTDAIDFDVIDMQERLRATFPNLLEIRRENIRTASYEKKIKSEREMDPYELCKSFLKELSPEEDALLLDVIHTVQGVK